MFFWIFMLLSSLLIPFIMIGFGRYFLKHAPKTINYAFGYRTAMSMKNQETWNFAHHYIGRLWFRCGLILLPASAAAYLPVIGRDDDTVGGVGVFVTTVQLLLLIIPILPTERALRAHFDRDGNPRKG